jgi:hypothetical protein
LLRNPAAIRDLITIYTYTGSYGPCSLEPSSQDQNSLKL